MDADLIIRKVTIDDVCDVLDLIEQFKEEALNKTMVSFNLNTLAKRTLEAIQKDNPSIILAHNNGKAVGMIAYITVNSYFDQNQIMALELMWYVDKDYRNSNIGKKLLEAAEKDLASKKVNTLTMIAGHYSVNTGKDKVLDIFYQRQGYKKLETHYIKQLNGGQNV